MKILYHFPSPDTTNAYRTIYNGFKNAFIDLGHEFYVLTADGNLENILRDVNPDIFITSSHFFYQKYLDYDLLKKYRDRGMIVFTKIDFWNSPFGVTSFNEAKSLKNDYKTVSLIKKNLLGDVFFHVVEQGDERMSGFKEATGFDYYTIPLAADKIVLKNEFDSKFKADISFVGTYLSQKKLFFENYVFPLKEKYRLKIYGQNWSRYERFVNFIQKIGQYFNIPYLKSVIKPKLSLEDEGKIYNSSLISINVHEDYQKKYGGDCNERTFKIPLSGGFEICDDVACIRKYFKEGEEIVIAKDREDWFNKIKYYIENPRERDNIIKRGMDRVLCDHTYHNRAKQILDIYSHVKYGKN